MYAARTILAVTLLLTLLTGNIVWSAASAGGPMCTLACCAGRAPHAAGSCMNGSCQAGVSEHDHASSSFHHHHEETQAEGSGKQKSGIRSQKSEVSRPDPNVPAAFAGAMASVHGSDDQETQTIDATIDATADEHSADNLALSPDEHRVGKLAVSALSLSKPCSPECGACAAGFMASRRSRHAAAIAVRNRAQSPIANVRPNCEQNLTSPGATFGRTSTPRGPPPHPAC